MKNEYIQIIQGLLTPYENKQEAIKMKQYMRNQYDFLGIRAPQRKQLVRFLIKEHGLPSEESFKTIIYELWALPERDYQSIALELIDRKSKQFKEDDIELIEDLITNKSWWDTVDWIASKHAGNYFLQYPENKWVITERWIQSDNIWLQRSAIIFQLKYKTDTDEAHLYDYITQCLGSDEFFINKAIGWALREYSKINPQSVLDFVDRTPLPKFSRTEALKVIKQKS
ncbi:DNA alkylation repair protein [Gracilibacillus alcaliphilus]|uniref:DNA alkylation repair protein n=1 Tax=Gracilibacillus alcaliphilus TaxID=1401441 RepID=UPI0019568608|nr:DNA alkylation repair protein [Gracilibacillus alcaliphilus]MBM7677864.1 3-methyladenine DNA glycosylase AlkD [Gracilibacillus alcaliphilus]